MPVPGLILGQSGFLPFAPNPTCALSDVVRSRPEVFHECRIRDLIPAAHSSSSSNPTEIEEGTMTFDSEDIHHPYVSKLLQETAAQTGFTAAEMQEILESELSTDQLLEYITAFVSNQM